MSQNPNDGEPSTWVVVVAVISQRDGESISSTRSESSSGDRDITHIWAFLKDLAAIASVCSCEARSIKLWEMSCTLSSVDY